MAEVTIIINSREYAVACDDGEEAHILKLARILDEKAKMLTSNGAQINENMLLAMVGLLVADELVDARNGVYPEPRVETVEKVVERVVEKEVEPDLSPLDEKLAQSVSEVDKQLKNLILKIESARS